MTTRTSKPETEAPKAIPEHSGSGFLQVRKRPVRFGLALGAGSTKGLAHIGVLQVLEQNGIIPDMVSGSSMGAIVGAIYCAGTDLEMLEKYACSLQMRQYYDISSRLHGGLLKGDKLQDMIRMLTHDRDFEQTRIPFLCTAVDADSGRLDILDSGKLHPAVRASMSLPAVFRPVRLNGKTYIDGGVIERVPCKALRDRGMDVVIGVDVGYQGGAENTSGMNAYDLINHTIHIMQWEIMKGRRQQADLMLVPKVQHIRGYFQMEGAADTIAEGRRACSEALPEIRRLTGRG